MSDSISNWYKDDEFLTRWVRSRAKATKLLFGKVWRRWISFLVSKERWNPTPEELVIDYEKDLETPIRLGGGETGRRIERFYIWLSTEYENPSIVGKHLARSSARAYSAGILSFYRNNTGQKVPFDRLVRDVFPKGKAEANDVKRRTSKVHADLDIQPPKVFREHYSTAGFKAGDTVVFEMVEVSEGEVTLKIVKVE